jgi:hypothetical protein
MKRIAIAVVAVLAVSGPGLARGSGKAPGWTVYADCAAAYLANARIADPDRPAAMTAQVSDVSRDYEAAAVARYRPAKGSGTAVRARIERQAKALAARPREAVEKVIDACPQVGGPD